MRLFTLATLLPLPRDGAPSLRATLRPWLAKLDSEVEDGATEVPWTRPRTSLLRGAVLGLVGCLMGAAPDPADPAAAAEIE